MSTIRDELKSLIDAMDDPELLLMWHVAARMKRPEVLSPEESAEVDQILKEIDSGEFTEWRDLRRAI
jgi:hypothetical protein